MRVITGTRRQFNTDTVGLLLHAARIGAHEGKIADRADDVLPNRGIHAVVRADGPADGPLGDQPGAPLDSTAPA